MTVINADSLQQYILPWITNIENIQTIKKYTHKARFKIFQKGNIIMHQGEKSAGVMYLTKGTVKVSALTIEGNEKTFWYNEAKCIIGEVIFFHGCESNASIIAVSQCEGYVFSSHDFMSILNENPKLYFDVAKAMAVKIRVLCSQIEELVFVSPQQKICKFIYFFAKKHGIQNEKTVNIYLNITQSDIASINSLHRITVTKVLNDLKKQKILINNRKGEIVIYDMEKLKLKCGML